MWSDVVLCLMLEKEAGFGVFFFFWGVKTPPETGVLFGLCLGPDPPNRRFFFFLGIANRHPNLRSSPAGHWHPALQYGVFFFFWACQIPTLKWNRTRLVSLKNWTRHTKKNVLSRVVADSNKKKKTISTSAPQMPLNPNRETCCAAEPRACLLYTSPSPRHLSTSRMLSSA